MTADFHGDGAYAPLSHYGKQGVHIGRLGRCAGAGQHLITDSHAGRSDDPDWSRRCESGRQ